MQFDPDDMSVRDIYGWMVGLITPRPIAWVSTLSIDGIANLAPFSFFNGVGGNPPTIVFCPANNREGRPKDTLANIQRTGQFAVNLVTAADVEAMNLTSADFAADEDEFALASIAKAPCDRIDVPRVAQAAATLECQLHSAIQLGTGPGGANLVIGRVVYLHVSDAVVDETGRLRADKLDTIGRMGGAQYVRTSDRFEMPRPKRPTV
ncbi:MAG: flavin reductase family protein [Pirellulaceae bacterium]|nr:flavin reductase family protein [Pirellulaceae bacterium]